MKLLDFDSKLFGYKVAQLKNIKSFDKLQDAHVRLAYFFVDPKDIEKNRLAKFRGGILVDKKVEYCMSVSKIRIKKISEFIIDAYDKKSPSKSLIDLALQSGVYSRFATDKHFTHNEYKKLYTTWIGKSVNILVYVDNRQEKGFITLERDGRIGLVAVDEAYRGKSIGMALVNKACERFDKLGFKKIIVTTQKKNVVACRFYESFGFKKVKTENVYHFWL